MADPGFSRGGGREPSRGGVNTPNFPENCMKSKEFGRPGGGRASLTPPPRSANEYIQFNRNFCNVEGLKLLKGTNKQILDSWIIEREGLGGVALRGDYEDSPPNGRRG